MNNEYILKYILKKTDNTLIQFFRYIFVGVIATIVDMSTLFLLTSKYEIFYLISTAIAFIFGVITNYFISIIWVFRSSRNFKKEFFLFVAIGVFGLILNELIMFILVSKLNLFYMFAKATAVFLILIWNFGMRKAFVFNGL